ncbi:hypothetical protein NIES37_52000 [Tolypothrix tenuis PCC 7101]|uniref:Uncharacterized protein n=1 Tax=Tolypothrix tenuis PCC 7101 TaxID=231146 RepID=A0A1Z4N676_9CYAN|nr:MULTISPECIES: hypothetical protein [unclassified Tolypothrix]MBD2238231.1 hypothetical protein [Aulosira sp. FACHB-113]BAY34291.1 hypothetical protein NIES2107_61960 [Nostoc carneum NIES-2107]BAY91516.1 hypothetical protein NIES3275_35400 [Microchaete diplosiphon NIES-3275]BAZ01201.1 hypothetical protein NIES37_52000 [Tolypothrix tenuis PCC 7101]BAZ74877.1 hypothetical protein NIES50_34560 [Aulosira laxa NIES-50]
MSNKDFNRAIDSSDRVESDVYDRGIVPAETAARKEREGDLYKTLPTEEREASAPTDDQTEGDSIRTTDGYTVDKEGLLNNYAVEPEMYYEVPGDARQEVEQDIANRSEELIEANEDKEGQLTDKDDVRGKGPGIV